MHERGIKIMPDKTELQKCITTIWADYCDLDYWIDDMNKGGCDRIPKNVMKMAMKHLRSDLYRTHKILCRLEVGSEMEEDKNDD
jgi:hypothetical protein